MNQDMQARFIGITVEGLLRPCGISPVRTACGYGYVWEWSASERATRSQRTFDMFFDCLEDARSHGYEPHFLDGKQTPGLAIVPVTARA